MPEREGNEIWGLVRMLWDGLDDPDGDVRFACVVGLAVGGAWLVFLLILLALPLVVLVERLVDA